MENYKNATLPIDTRIADLLARMTLAEKIGQLNQIPLSSHTLCDIEAEIRSGNVGSLIYATSALAGNEEQFAGSLAQREECQHIAVEETRLGIPLINGSNIVHGHRTASVIPLGQAASWNDALVEDFAAISALEATADGIHWTFAPMLDIAHDPRWGRIAEGFGEDPYLCSRLGAASVKGFQGENLSENRRIAACCKHYVGYGAAEGGRDYESVEISESTLRNIYLPSFKACVESGAATVMSAFHENNGTPVTADHHLLTDILKDEYGFDGFVISDWDAVRQLIHQRIAADAKQAAQLAFHAGVDMDMLSLSYVHHLTALVQEGAISQNMIDDAVTRVLRVKFKLGLFENPYTPKELYNEVVLCASHRKKARELAAESIVLLKNESNVLPLAAQKIVAIGPMLFEQEALLGTWAMESLPQDVVSIAQGLQNNARLQNVSCCASTLSDLALQDARNADVVVVALGESNHSSGEAKSVADIVLPAGQMELLRHVKRFGKKIVTLVCAGRSLAIEELVSLSDAVLYCWQGGIEAGNAIADILSGNVNPSGRLPVTLPRHTGQIPLYYNHKSNGRAIDEYYGDIDYPNYVDMSGSPLFPFGFGLSYTDFTYDNLQCVVDTQHQTVTASITVKNTGSVAGATVVQCYVQDCVCSITLPVRQLKAYQKIELAPDETQTVTFTLCENDLSFYDKSSKLSFEHGDFQIWIGADCLATQTRYFTL